MLISCATLLAQDGTTAIAYDRAAHTMTSLYYRSGGYLTDIIISGNDQTTITVGDDGLPTEICSSNAMVEFDYSGDNDVTMTETVNGTTKTQNVTLDNGTLPTFREEYLRANSNLSLIDKADRFLANGGAKKIGMVLDVILGKNPIAACFQEALESCQSNATNMISINKAEALAEAQTARKAVTGLLTEGIVDAIFKGYPQWTEGWSKIVYNWQMSNYEKQKKANQEEQQGRKHLVEILLNEGYTPEEAAEAIIRGENGGELPEPELPDYSDVEEIIKYVQDLAKEKGSMPERIRIDWTRTHSAFLDRAGQLVLNKDKKTYSYEEFIAGSKDLDWEIEEPYVELIFNGDERWRTPGDINWNLNVKLPLKKITK